MFEVRVRLTGAGVEGEGSSCVRISATRLAVVNRHFRYADITWLGDI